jgi:hypothetical protein
VHGFVLGAQAHHTYVFANRRADRIKVLVFDGVGMWPPPCQYDLRHLPLIYQ